MDVIPGMDLPLGPLSTSGLPFPCSEWSAVRMNAAQPVPLVRHGETEWSRSGRHTGRTDLPLLPEGDGPGRAAGPGAADRPFTTVLTSPLLRARQTCALAGFGEVAEVDPDLAEWDYGAYEGLTTAESERTSSGLGPVCRRGARGRVGRGCRPPGRPGHRAGADGRPATWPASPTDTYCG